MKISRRIVVNRPKTVQALGGRRQATWMRRAVLHEVWKLRREIIRETGEDIFGVFVMPDCIEININGELDTFRVKDIKSPLK